MEFFKQGSSSFAWVTAYYTVFELHHSIIQRPTGWDWGRRESRKKGHDSKALGGFFFLLLETFDSLLYFIIRLPSKTALKKENVDFTPWIFVPFFAFE